MDHHKTPVILQAAVKIGDKEAVVSELAKNPESCKFIDKNGRTMLHLTFELVPLGTIDLLPAKSYFECESRIIEILTLFPDLGLNINSHTNVGETPLWLAVRRKMENVVYFLVSRGANVTVRNDEDDNLAHLIVRTVTSTKRQITLDFYDWLLSKGVDVDQSNCKGETPFMLSVMKNVPCVVKIMISHSKNVNYRNSNGQNILHCFMQYYWADKNIIKMLLESGVSVDTKDNIGRTPLHYAMDCSPLRLTVEVLKNLLDRMENINACDRLDGNTALHLAARREREFCQELILGGADCNVKNKKGLSPLQVAVRFKNYTTANVFKQSVADFGVQTCNGDTLLHLVGKSNINKNISQSDEEKILDLLITQGCNINATNSVGYTPLHVAASSGSLTVVKGLLKSGADACCKSKRNVTPLHLAVLKGNEGIVEELVKFKADVDATDSENHLSPLQIALLNDSLKIVHCLFRNGADINNIAAPKQKALLDLISRKRIWPCIIDHLVKLQAAKMPVENALKRFISLKGQEKISLFKQCTDEIECMKKECIVNNTSTSYYDFLIADPLRRHYYLEKANFDIRDIDSITFKKKFLTTVI